MKMTLIMPALVAGLLLSIGLNTPAAAQALSEQMHLSLGAAV